MLFVGDAPIAMMAELNEATPHAHLDD